MSALDSSVMQDEVFQKFHMEQIARAKTCIGKKFADLSESDKFAIALSAGVRVRFFSENLCLRGETEPCGITEDGMGGFIVATRIQTGETITIPMEATR